MAIIRRHKMAVTTVVNINADMEYDVYIGRGSLFGNPYRIGWWYKKIKNGIECRSISFSGSIKITRKISVQLYQEWFYKRIKYKNFKLAVLKLKGKRLGCFCWPLLCHGYVIADYLRKVAA